MDKNDIIDYVMHTPHNTNRAVLSGMLNQLTEGGGGGSSEFSTAEVTVTSNSIDGDSTEFPFAYVFRELSAIHYGAVAEYNNPLIYEAILFNGVVGFESPTSNVSTSGSATVNPGPGGRTIIIITGDCTITIS